MKKVQAKKLPAAVDSLRRRIETWRRTRKRVSTMPEGLWNAAVALAAEHGVCRIARAIRIDYAALKRRVKSPVEAKANQGFIELPTAAFPSDNGEAVFEFSDDTGARMTVRMSGRINLDVIAVASAFWNRRA